MRKRSGRGNDGQKSWRMERHVKSVLKASKAGKERTKKKVESISPRQIIINMDAFD